MKRTASGSNRPILVVEDNVLIREALEAALTTSGFPVKLAAHGQQALDLVEMQRPSLVFLDMNLPVMDGWAFYRELHARGFDPPVIIMTTGGNGATIAKQLGASGHLDKPFGLPELLAVIRQHRIP